MDDIRRDYSLDRLRQLGEKLDPVRPLLEGHSLCVYATGSYGRLEAWPGSDIDLFFLYDGASEDGRLPWTTFLRLAARLIDATEAMSFPPFSGVAAIWSFSTSAIWSACSAARATTR